MKRRSTSQNQEQLGEDIWLYLDHYLTFQKDCEQKNSGSYLQRAAAMRQAEEEYQEWTRLQQTLHTAYAKLIDADKLK